MQLKDIQLVFDTGVLHKAEVVLLLGKYVVLFYDNKGKQYNIDTQRGVQRKFSTLDSAANLIFQIGFKNFYVSY